MIKVLHVISGIDPQNGGTTAAILGMAKAQRSAGMDATVLSTWRYDSGLANADVFRAAGVPTAMIGRARGKLSRHPDIRQRLVDAVKEVDVVHVHGVWEEIQHAAMVVCRDLAKPFVITPHGLLAAWNMRQNRLLKRIYFNWRVRGLINTAAAIHFTSEDERGTTAILKITAPPVVERLGIDVIEFDNLPTRGSFRAQFPQIAGRKIVLFLGRIDYKKGLDRLIPSFAKATGDDAVLVLAGPDDAGYGERVRKLVRSSGIGNRVIFTGMLHGRERVEALVDADVFALTSYAENFGIAVVEALAAGLPVLISDRVNVSEYLREEAVGRVVPLDDAQIAAGLAGLLDEVNTPAGQTMRDNARRAARTIFSPAESARRWEGIYEKIFHETLKEQRPHKRP